MGAGLGLLRVNLGVQHHLPNSFQKHLWACDKRYRRVWSRGVMSVRKLACPRLSVPLTGEHAYIMYNASSNHQHMHTVDSTETIFYVPTRRHPCSPPATICVFLPTSHPPCLVLNPTLRTLMATSRPSRLALTLIFGSTLLRLTAATPRPTPGPVPIPNSLGPSAGLNDSNSCTCKRGPAGSKSPSAAAAALVLVAAAPAAGVAPVKDEAAAAAADPRRPRGLRGKEDLRPGPGKQGWQPTGEERRGCKHMKSGM